MMKPAVPLDANKAGQLGVVVGGCLLAVNRAVGLGATGGGDGVRAAVTVLFCISLAVRYWWVILLLPWPFTTTRIGLLFLVWSAVIAAASAIGAPIMWGSWLALVGLLGAGTEWYNDRDRQWDIRPPALRRVLQRDHRAGRWGALVASGVMLAATAWTTPPTQLLLIALLVLLDVVRLLAMIGAHRQAMGS